MNAYCILVQLYEIKHLKEDSVAADPGFPERGGCQDLSM